jgi:hypothetical protein
MDEKMAVKDKAEELADDLAAEVSGGVDVNKLECAYAILRDCHGSPRILRNNEDNKCPTGDRFLR